MSESTFYALLIGADYYFPNKLSNEATYASLEGCVSDVTRVEDMLRERLKGKNLSITKLLARNDGGDRPAGDESVWPTAQNIRRALAELAEAAQPGDQVYIHYSGHGGRVTTAWKDVKSGDGIDEALVPVDIGRPDAPGGRIFTKPERYIRDVELAHYLDRLANKGEGAAQPVVTTLVFDSCHSGGATRGGGVTARRASGGNSSGNVDRRELPPGVSPWGDDSAKMVETYNRLRSSVTQRSGTTLNWLPPAKGYVLLAGCRDAESALEASIDGRPKSGVLTEAFLEALGSIGDEQSWKTIYDRVFARVQSRFRSQTPQLLGEIDRHVFGVKLKPAEQTLTVAEVDVGDRTVKFNAGLALALERDSEVGIYRPGEVLFAPERRLAVAKIIQVNDLDSLASLDPGVDPAAIAIGAPAVLQSVPLRRTIELFRRDDLPPRLADRQGAALDAVGTLIETEAKGFLKVRDAVEAPHYQIVVSPAGEYEICDPQGNLYQYLEPTSMIDTPGGARDVVAKLRRLGRYHTVLEMSAPPSELPEQLDVQLLTAPANWDSSGRVLPLSVGGEPLKLEGDFYSVPSDTWIWMRLVNKQPSRPINVALLGLDRKWNVSMLVPNPNELYGKKYETVSEQPATFAFRMFAPVPETMDSFKLFMTTGDVDFRWLVTAAARRGLERGSGPGESLLGRTIEAIAGAQARTRDSAAPASSWAPWSVRDFRIRTYQ